MKTIGQQIQWDFETNGDLVIKGKNGKYIYFEDSDGYWVKREYDSQGKEIYSEDSDGGWCKYEYDSQGNQIYYEDSSGHVIYNRPKPCEDKVVEIEGVKYKLVKE